MVGKDLTVRLSLVLINVRVMGFVLMDNAYVTADFKEKIAVKRNVLIIVILMVLVKMARVTVIWVTLELIANIEHAKMNVVFMECAKKMALVYAI